MKFIYKLDLSLKQTNKQKRKKQMYYVTDYGRSMKPFFVETQNF